MHTDGDVITLNIDSRVAIAIQHALSAPQRVRLLRLLAGRSMNVNDIAAALGITQSTASSHIRVLQEAGLVKSTFVSTDKGAEKRCRATFTRLVFENNVDPADISEDVQEVVMPIGLYTAVSVEPHCGLADDVRVLGSYDDPQVFLSPERVGAQILWCRAGWLEYTMPCQIPSRATVTGVEFEAELCAEAPGYNNDYPSDLTVWMNGVEIATWRAPGSFGGRRGRLNPTWWPDCYTQNGELKTWSIDATASRIDGKPAGTACLTDLDISPDRPIVVRLGNKDDAEYRNGMNLFGKRFGNYAQDIVFRIRYTLSPA